MRFRIVWLSTLIRRLAHLYVFVRTHGGETDPITRSMADLDRMLEAGPLEVGESREAEKRIAFVGPLTFLFEVHEDLDTVIVTDVRVHDRRQLFPATGGEPS